MSIANYLSKNPINIGSWTAVINRSNAALSQSYSSSASSSSFGSSSSPSAALPTTSNYTILPTPFSSLSNSVPAISTANIANDPHFTPLTNADLSGFSCGQRDSTQTRFYSNGEEKDELAHSLACAHAQDRKSVV